MKAIRFSGYGGPEVLDLVDVDDPEPGHGEILVAVRAAGVNGIDHKLRAGHLKDFMPLSLPAGTGFDAAGTVIAVGGGVEGVVVGDEVFGNGRDTLAESAVLTSWALVPDGLSPEEAAGYPLPVETAIRVLDVAAVRPGETVVISGASGGVGSAAVQFALHRGARVIGTASEENQAYLRSLGATATTYGDGLVERVRALAGGPVHAALDIAGSGVLPELVDLTGDPERVVTIADFGGAGLGVRTSSAAGDHRAALAEVVDLVRRGRFRIPVARSFPLDRAGEAHESCARGHIAGRTVVTVR
ncbi:NADP-dependent oxidoreductase [Umezawaea endophytica]|uniref:NADP-dependent oxidoreductase n=1 Tax=Umezawaea endophytica TaxID=1654476 RepID=A0A9X2VG04_9PSEU|nr:NADP-dependent oxidoreductase [Umezawaea endophytica]MCS7475886.1 NADP-dependent oxidoreductase [Umezawaea endophytica]